MIIPTYNRAYTLTRALNSVLQQTLQPNEIIVIDDGSTDQTQPLIKQQFPAIKYIHQSQQGVSAARNTGIQQATGEWIALLDSDDAWHPDKLQQQISALKTNYHLLCHTNERWIRNGKDINLKKQHAKLGGWVFQDCLPLCMISPSSSLIHYSIFKDIGLFDTDLPACEDYDLWLRITAKYPVLFLEDTLTIKYGGHEDQLSMQYWGMDRFRISALQKIIASGQLGPDDHCAAIHTIRKKIEIYLIGARKRNKIDDIQYYENLLTQAALAPTLSTPPSFVPSPSGRGLG